jgi:hypothetical protein
MQNDKELAVNDIMDKLKEQVKVENPIGYSLAIGNKVRLIENKHTMKKTRYNVIPFYCIISDITWKSITISVIERSVKTVTRSRVIPLRSNEMNSCKQAKTMPGQSRGSIVEILSYNPKK